MDEDKSPDESSEDQVTEDEAKQPVSEYVNNIPSLQAQKRRKKMVAIVIILVLLAVGVLGSIFIVNTARDNAQPNDEAPELIGPPEETQRTISEETENYQSPQFFLNFNHPQGWEVNDDRVAGLLTVTSPELDLPGVDGSSISGKVIFTIRAKKQKLPEFEGGNALAVTDSEKIKYAKPSQAQRGETYLSFLSYAGSASSGLIDGIFITGDFGYQKDQAIPLVDIKKIDPIINVSFVACDGSCETAASVPASAWQSEGFGQQIKKIFESLHIN